MATPVLIDCDPGHDDAIALMLALASPELELLGVTTVAGNTTLAQTTANAIRVLEAVGRGDVPVAAGSRRPLLREPLVADFVHGDSGLDGPALPPPQGEPVADHAVDFIARRLLGAESPVTLIPVGPLTNIALLLARHPDVVDRIGAVVLMGGAIAEGNVTPAAEFNIWADPEAAQRVFDSGLDVTMVGLDATHKVLALPEHVERLRHASGAGRLAAHRRSAQRPRGRRRGCRGLPRAADRAPGPAAVSRGVTGTAWQPTRRRPRIARYGEGSAGPAKGAS